ncbi:MAG: UDP-N-acetylmuramoyl-tripeptide--D-alanyl-D-alanine ligase [Deltaproteobacteria bacterium]
MKSSGRIGFISRTQKRRRSRWRRGRIKKLNLDFVIKATGGSLISKWEDADFSGVSTDSRRIRRNELFFALSGDNFDGHDFVAEALANGAKGAVVEKYIAAPKSSGKILIHVPSALKALGDVALDWRMSFPNLKVAAITGSNGKTTTKEMTSSVLGLKFSALKNSGNFNNLIGLPLTLLKLDDSHGAAVVELGMNNFGEIEKLRDIARPDTGAITNIGRAHLEKLGGIEGVAKAKGELVERFSSNNTFVVNMDDERVASIASRINCRKITFSATSEAADIFASEITAVDFSAIRFNILIKGRATPVQIKGIGFHNVMNALCAAGVGLSFGCSADEIVAGLERHTPPYMRLEVMDTRFGFKIINDAYNANPDSMRRAVEELSRLKGSGRAIAVVGDMLELGEASEREHRSLGEFIAGMNIDFLITHGELASLAFDEVRDKIPAAHAGSHDEAASLALGFARKGDLVLIKGSRGMKMENVIRRFFED